jgi:hypothetical protein
MTCKIGEAAAMFLSRAHTHAWRNILQYIEPVKHPVWAKGREYSIFRLFRAVCVVTVSLFVDDFR